MKTKNRIIVYSTIGILILMFFLISNPKRKADHNRVYLEIANTMDNIDQSNIEISEEKYREISKVLDNYLSHNRMSEKERREFIYGLCDTIHPCRNNAFFRYSSKINGYNVEGWFQIIPKGSEYESERSVYASIFFSSDSHSFKILHSTFQPFKDSIPDTINALDCIELDYETPVFPNPQKISLDSIHNLPFAFVDINFDGVKELLLTNPGNGQKTIDTYTAYLLPQIEKIDPFQGYLWNCLDEWTEFDYTTKTVISSLWGGYEGSEKWYFRYEGDRLKPYLKEEYTHWFDSIKTSTPIP